MVDMALNLSKVLLRTGVRVTRGSLLGPKWTGPALLSRPKPCVSHLPIAGLTGTANRLSAHVQQSAPPFQGLAVVDGRFKEISLEDYQGKYVVLFFYPLDFTFVCPTEIIAFSDRAEEFRQLDTEVIGVSVDSHFSHLAWINMPRKVVNWAVHRKTIPYYFLKRVLCSSMCDMRHTPLGTNGINVSFERQCAIFIPAALYPQEGGLGQMNIPLLSDFKKNISRDYGVLLEDAGLALRGLFLIDPEGVIKHLSVNDLPVGRSVDEVLRLVKAFQFVQKHGEVCPAGWTPDSDTIKPDPQGAKEYFSKASE